MNNSFCFITTKSKLNYFTVLFCHIFTVLVLFYFVTHPGHASHTSLDWILFYLHVYLLVSQSDGTNFVRLFVQNIIIIECRFVNTKYYLVFQGSTDTGYLYRYQTRHPISINVLPFTEIPSSSPNQNVCFSINQAVSIPPRPIYQHAIINACIAMQGKHPRKLTAEYLKKFNFYPKNKRNKKGLRQSAKLHDLDDYIKY